jgi:hypothetical protein
MMCSIGESLADYGFVFYEKLHEPIFLLNRIGRVIKINEAGRKLMKIAKLSLSEIEAQTRRHVEQLHFKMPTNKLDSPLTSTTVLNSKNQKIHLTTSYLPNSEYLLVEVRR